MTKEEMFLVMNANPAFHLATIEKGSPRVRGMFLYRADGDGIIFHTGVSKEVFAQIAQNPDAELCFNDLKGGVQIRVRGTLDLVEDTSLKDEIVSHPTRAFLKPWLLAKGRDAFYQEFIVVRLRGGKACAWTMASNFAPKEFVQI